MSSNDKTFGKTMGFMTNEAPKKRPAKRKVRRRVSTNMGVGEPMVYKRKGRNVPLTRQESVAQTNLKRIWDTTAKSFGLTQAGMAKKYEVNASHVSQLKNGFLPLNFNWLMRFAKELQCAPEEIFPGYREYFKVGGGESGATVPSIRLTARIRQGISMPVTTRETIEYPNFSPDSSIEAVEVLSEGAEHAFIPFGSHVLFDRDVPATRGDNLAVGVNVNDPRQLRILRHGNAGWVDVFDGMAVNSGWQVFKVQGIIYNG